MTKEQLSELAEALNILTAKSSIVKERRELQTLLEDNMLSEAVSCLLSILKGLQTDMTGIQGATRRD